MSDLIDTTEMYLRTIFELEEEGVVPMRARIAERLGQSGPTVSQTVARMERDGLLTVEDDRHLVLSTTGRDHAERVMRRHRLAECLLVDVIGLDLADVHAEACRWEHVMSEAVEERLLEVLDHPTVSPFGNPIPGLDKLRGGAAGEDADEPLMALAAFGEAHADWVTVRRIEEHVQDDTALMTRLRSAGALPGETVKVRRSHGGGVLVGNAGEYAELDLATAAHILVRPAALPPSE